VGLFPNDGLELQVYAKGKDAVHALAIDTVISVVVEGGLLLPVHFLLEIVMLSRLKQSKSLNELKR